MCYILYTYYLCSIVYTMVGGRNYELYQRKEYKIKGNVHTHLMYTGSTCRMCIFLNCVQLFVRILY